MSTKKIEIHVSEEVYSLIKKAAEKGIRRGRGEPVVVTISEMATSYVVTGVYRRIAANKWTRKQKLEGGKPAKKAAPKKTAAKKQAPKAKIVKLPKKKTPKAAKPASSSAAAPAAANLLE